MGWLLYLLPDFAKPPKLYIIDIRLACLFNWPGDNRRFLRDSALELQSFLLFVDRLVNLLMLLILPSQLHINILHKEQQIETETSASDDDKGQMCL